MDKLYKRVKEHTWKDTGQNRSILGKQGTSLTDPDAVSARGKEYIEELYNKTGKPEEIAIEPGEVREDEKGPDVLDSEIEQAIRDLKTGKAEGVDGISAEMLKALDAQASRLLQHHMNGQSPNNLSVTIVPPMCQRPQSQQCQQP